MQEKNGLEIEKKYLVVSLPERLEDYQKKELEQVYLCINPVIRVRRSDGDYILTYKSRVRETEFDQPLNSDIGFGESDVDIAQEDGAKVCHEVELPLGEDGYCHLCEKADGRKITKTRYLIPLPGTQGLTAELDIFARELEGLRIVEVEFPDRGSAAAFKPPDWFGKDVSSDERYTNSWLSQAEDKALWKLLTENIFIENLDNNK